MGSTSAIQDAPTTSPSQPVPLAQAPPAGVLWSRLLILAWVALGLFVLDQLSLVLFDYWMFESLQLQSVFWTNLRTGAYIFLIAFAGMAGGVVAPVFAHRVKGRARSLIVQLGLLAGLIGGYLTAMQYGDFLFAAADVKFNQVDTVFGNDFGFYVFDLPAIWITWQAVMYGALLSLASSLVCAWLSREDRPQQVHFRPLFKFLGSVGTLPTRIGLGVCGLVAAVGAWLTRYDLLIRDNYGSSIFAGAQYVDVVGLFSNFHYPLVTALVIVGLTVVAVLFLTHLNGRQAGRPSNLNLKKLAYAAAILVAVDFAFAGLIELRDTVFVDPNEPVIQLDYIDRHIQATRKAYNLDDITEVEFIPLGADDPIPANYASTLVEHPTLKNAPLWPGFESYLEEQIDPQHSARVLLTGSNRVYGPTIEMFNQQQALRPYYEFMNVDAVRYKINGEKKMLVSSVRELPLHVPLPWLTYWGQRFILFTHGHGLVMAPASGVSTDGEPEYVSSNIPSKVKPGWEELTAKQQGVYYAKGAATMAFSNIDKVEELDYPTPQGRKTINFPQDVHAGVHVDSLLKRLVFGYRSGKFFEMVFSDLITDKTRIHYYRTPIERVRRVAPFLYYDSNPYAVVADGGKLLWMINAMTTSARYPYSIFYTLGDKSDERNPFSQPLELVNYVEDSVKITVDAYTGALRLYKISDSPVVQTWAQIYPDLFTDGQEMPESVRAQLTYPTHLFHVQFDDLYIDYHMAEPMYFFNQEDAWDDADEVLGPILAEGKAITFSQEPAPVIVETGGLLPEAKEKLQFALVMPFTPGGTKNLRAIPIVYQDGEDYGRKVVLTVPKGIYYPGPEQADAAIDQDPEISGKFGWWDRMGMEVIRGHTSTLVVGREVLYVEPIFLRSLQNPISQLKRVIVVFRGTPGMGKTLKEALTTAIEAHRASKTEG